MPTRRRGGICLHGHRLSCAAKHTRDDTRLGEPLCPECYDYTGAVLFNACVPELWRRFAITLRRALARQAGLTGKAFATAWGELIHPDTGVIAHDRPHQRAQRSAGRGEAGRSAPACPVASEATMRHPVWLHRMTE
jgi:hypothetical protein